MNKLFLIYPFCEIPYTSSIIKDIIKEVNINKLLKHPWIIHPWGKQTYTDYFMKDLFYETSHNYFVNNNLFLKHPFYEISYIYISFINYLLTPMANMYSLFIETYILWIDIIIIHTPYILINSKHVQSNYWVIHSMKYHYHCS